MKVVYIAGPFRGPDAWAIENNIRRAEGLALEVWKLGAAAICPHANTRFFQGVADDSLWLKGDLEILARCDAVLLTPDWYLSEGVRHEKAQAIVLGIPVFYELRLLELFITGAVNGKATAVETSGSPDIASFSSHEAAK